jgi:DHA1 family bicyclomycin/chloramphenicol resistance-like MFS transporter
MRLKPDTLAMTVCLALLTALGPLSTDMYLPSLPAIARELEATTAQTQATLSVFLVGFAVGQFVYGPVSDRVGRKPMMLAGLALFLVASVVCTVAPTIETLTAARFVQALGASGPIVLGRAVVRDLYEGARAGRELSRMGFVMGVVPAAAPVLGGLVGEWGGWRATFAVTTLLGLALVGVVLGLLPETLRARSTAPLSILAILRGFGALLRHPATGLRGALLAQLRRLFAFISGSSFVLQGVYGLAELPYAFSFAFTGAASWPARSSRRGWSGPGGSTAPSVRASSPWRRRAPDAGAGRRARAVLARHHGADGDLHGRGRARHAPAVAAAMLPFGGQARAASSLLGICQMTFAALVGAGLGPSARGLGAAAAAHGGGDRRGGAGSVPAERGGAALDIGRLASVGIREDAGLKRGPKA